MSITALETGLYSALSGAAGLTTELGGTLIYNKRAPQSPGNKYVIFRQQAGGDVNDTPVRSRNVVYAVFGVALTQEAAAAIDTQIDSALHGVTLTVSGWTNYWTAREADVNLVEADSGGVDRYHAGGLYRIRIDKS